MSWESFEIGEKVHYMVGKKPANGTVAVIHYDRVTVRLEGERLVNIHTKLQRLWHGWSNEDGRVK